MEEQRAQARKEQDEQNRKKLAGKKVRIRYTPPGLKIIQDTTLRFFKRRNLNLEKDFDYKQRPYFRRECDMNDEKIDEMFNIPWKFILALAPGISTPLVQDNLDYIKICDFLFFSHVSTQNLETAEMTKRALFTMLRGPYDFWGWKFGLKHILPALLNLGLEESSVLNDETWNKRIMAYRLQELKKEFKIKDFLPQFFTDRFDKGKKPGDLHVDPDSDTDGEKYEVKLSYLDSDNDENGNPRPMPEEYKWKTSKKDITVRVIKMISDIITTFPHFCEVVPKDGKEWTQTIATFYILSTVASDWHIIVNHKVKHYISEAFRVMLDAFSPDVWCQVDDQGKARNSIDFVSCDITEAMAIVGNYDGAENIYTWDPKDINSPFFRKREHHHNLIRRVWLLPQTHRGRIVRKMLAYNYLTYFVNKDDDSQIIPFVDVKDLWTEFISKNQKVLEGFADDYYMMMNLIRLIDVVVGNEPMIDFKIRPFREFITPIELYLSQIKKVIDKEVRDGAKLNSYIGLIIHKWKACHEIWAKANRAKVTKYDEKRKKVEEEQAKKSAPVELN